MGPKGKLTERIEAIARHYGISSLYVYGSRAEEIAARVKGQEIPARLSHADVDIGVHPEKDRHLSAQDRVKLSLELEDLFGVNRVDLMVLPEAPAFLALDIIREELLYCADADEQAEYELFVLRRAADLAPYAQEKWREILK